MIVEGRKEDQMPLERNVEKKSDTSPQAGWSVRGRSRRTSNFDDSGRWSRVEQSNTSSEAVIEKNVDLRDNRSTACGVLRLLLFGSIDNPHREKRDRTREVR
jgi:hypothetical protein